MTEQKRFATIDIRKYKSILCLHGHLPNYEFFKGADIPIIAADGGANELRPIGIKPDLIVGDLDSVHPSILSEIRHLKIDEQDSSDFQKAVQYIVKNSLTPSIVCGINGGYLDHILNNIGVFMSTNFTLYDENVIGSVLKKGKYQFSFQRDTKLSIFGIPRCRISTTGLRWNLTDTTLSFPQCNSSFNRASSNEILINIAYGAALMLVYTIPMIDNGLYSYGPETNI
ncbi:MAG: thiamine diphosphokinase [Holosporales bacterium]|jgi:thiamine pyrophosphokinase|nr:thiamine diphosphokinase [Holosporales bacterium]